MNDFTKLEAIRGHFGLVAKPFRTSDVKRVQKNLSILASDAKRLFVLAKRDRMSQARLLSAALDAYEEQRGKRD